MANNRLYLCHRPSGMIVAIGKRIGLGWYGGGELLSKFYEEVEKWHEKNDNLYFKQDDFVLLHDEMENWEVIEQKQDGFWIAKILN